jgi:hypothetical protein
MKIKMAAIDAGAVTVAHILKAWSCLLAWRTFTHPSHLNTNCGSVFCLVCSSLRYDVHVCALLAVHAQSVAGRRPQGTERRGVDTRTWPSRRRRHRFTFWPTKKSIPVHTAPSGVTPQAPWTSSVARRKHKPWQGIFTVFTIAVVVARAAIVPAITAALWPSHVVRDRVHPS